MHLASTRKMSGNALQITPAQRVIAEAMNGAVPDSDDIAAAERIHISDRLLHLSVAAALRQALMSRPSVGSRGETHRRSGGSSVQSIRDAYYLALALAADADGDPTSLCSIIGRDRHSWLEPAALVGKMQVRFLEQVCEQMELIANHLPVPAAIAPVPASKMFASGGRITDTTLLLPDHRGGEAGGSNDERWLHATSTVVIEGYSGTAVVDAGPSILPAAWSARIAAPITITAKAGVWPKSVVRDCLWLCQDAVREWVGSMTRELNGTNNEDLLLRVGPSLRRFLVSPASLAIARCAAQIADGAHTPSLGRRFNHRGDHTPDPCAVLDSGPLVAVEVDRTAMAKHTRAELLKSMRQVDENVRELADDIELVHAAALAQVHREELAMLSAAGAEELPEDVEVTVNLTVPDWQDVNALVGQLRSGGGARLTVGLAAYTDQEVVSGPEKRLSLRIRAHRGIPLRTDAGYAVFLSAGTRFTVLGVDVSKHHSTVYLEQEEPASPSLSASAGVMGVGPRRLNVA